MLQELESMLQTVADLAGPSTVAIGRDPRGCGVVIAPGQVLTNAHLLRDRTTQVTFADGRAVQASVVAADLDGDHAVLAVDTGAATPLTWSDTAPVTGQVVVAAARGRHGLRVTTGTVSAVDQAFRGPRGRRIPGGIEHTAPLARGSSGGPLLDSHGRLVGINTLRLGHGFTLARPGDAALRARVADLARGRTPVTPRLGVALAPAEVAARLRRAVGLPEREGLLVRGVVADGPADRAGIREGDLLVAAAGRPLRTVDDLAGVLDTHDPAAPLTVGFVRGVDDQQVEVRFTADPDPGGPEGAPGT